MATLSELKKQVTDLNSTRVARAVTLQKCDDEVTRIQALLDAAKEKLQAAKENHETVSNMLKDVEGRVSALEAAGKTDEADLEKEE